MDCLNCHRPSYEPLRDGLCGVCYDNLLLWCRDEIERIKLERAGNGAPDKIADGSDALA